METWSQPAGPIHVRFRSRFTAALAVAWLSAWLSACRGPAQGPAPVATLGSPPASPATPAAPRGPIAPAPPGEPDPDLSRVPPPRLLAIDWSTVSVATEAEALALWAKIAPTGDDWEAKLDELPPVVERPLAVALLREGNFTCMKQPPPGDCQKTLFEVDAPALTAGLGDPCLRRRLGLWAIAQLDEADLPAVLDALRAIVAIPPPESELHDAAFTAIRESDHATRLELLSIAWRAGQLDVVTSAVGKLDEAHLIEAVTKHHLDGALEILSAEGHRDVYLAAVTDEALGAKARVQAMLDLAALDLQALAPDIRAALVKATRSKDCTVAAAAARTLEQHGDRKYVPTRPRRGNVAAMMRSLCVLASYELLQRADEASLLQTFVPANGLERVMVAYDPLASIDAGDPDGDGDPHTERTIDRVARAEVVIPEIESMVRAMKRCTGTVCRSEDHEFHFGLRRVGGALALVRLGVVERPPCPRSP